MKRFYSLNDTEYLAEVPADTFLVAQSIPRSARNLVAKRAWALTDLGTKTVQALGTVPVTFASTP